MKGSPRLPVAEQNDGKVRLDCHTTGDGSSRFRESTSEQRKALSETGITEILLEGLLPCDCSDTLR